MINISHKNSIALFLGGFVLVIFLFFSAFCFAFVNLVGLVLGGYLGWAGWCGLVSSGSYLMLPTSTVISSRY